uniref:Uncharacterized protein n=1 Tax=Salix viminalis TaxID=40686 RepID=A0A6N2NCT4_SALVM
MRFTRRQEGVWTNVLMLSTKDSKRC